MTKKLLLAFGLLSTCSFGQTFTANNEYTIGESQTMYMCDSAAPTYENVTGNGVTWDYSTYYKVNNPNRTYQIIENTNADFPNANKVASVQNFFDTYIVSNGTEKSVEGFQFTETSISALISKILLTDSIKVFNYDFNFNDSINDIHAGTMTGGAVNPTNNTCDGTSVSSFDGVGTLILSPTVTKTNVQRHHLKVNMNGTSFLGPIVLGIDQFEYFDFSDSKLPLLSLTSLKIFLNGSTTPTVKMKFLLNSEDLIFFVGIDEKQANKFEIYPNPSSDEITISSQEFDGTEKISIFDVSGKEVLISNESTISVNNLKSGIYFIEVEKGNSKFQQKFIKK
jgi:hypothetical protein